MELECLLSANQCNVIHVLNKQHNLYTSIIMQNSRVINEINNYGKYVNTFCANRKISHYTLINLHSKCYSVSYYSDTCKYTCTCLLSSLNVQAVH